jgi:hypothetical protein
MGSKIAFKGKMGKMKSWVIDGAQVPQLCFRPCSFFSPVIFL